jgi:hypothetical protein
MKHLLFILVLASALAGCGGPDSQPDPMDAANSAPAATVAKPPSTWKVLHSFPGGGYKEFISTTEPLHVEPGWWTFTDQTTHQKIEIEGGSIEITPIP